MSAEQRLLTLLFEEGRVLQNLKFFPGDECASAEELFDAAYEAISLVNRGESQSGIPACVNAPMTIGEAVARL